MCLKWTEWEVCENIRKSRTSRYNYYFLNGLFRRLFMLQVLMLEQMITCKTYQAKALVSKAQVFIKKISAG